ncbi:unnamed protein product [Rhodiola kirilowii]
MADSTLTDAEHVSDQAIQAGHIAPMYQSSAQIVMEIEIESNTRSAALQAAHNSKSVKAIVEGWIAYGKANRKRLYKFLAAAIVTTIMVGVVAAEFIICVPENHMHMVSAGTLMRNLGCFQFNWNTQSVISGFVFSRFTQTLRAPGYVKATEFVGLCSERSEIDDSLKLFDELPSRDVVSATAVISSFVRNNQYDKAMFLFFRMIASDIRPNEFTFGVLFQIPVAMYEGCIDDFGKRMGSNVGKQLHASAIKMGLISNVYAGSAALNFYSKVSDIEGATRVLEDTHKPNVVSYTTLICAYLKNEQFDDALSVFHTMPERNVVTWNAMIGGYSQTGKNEEAVNMFVEMLRGNVLPTQFTYPCVISAASNVAALGMGKSFHASAIKVLGNPNLFVGNSLVSFYSKCGTMEESLNVFNKLPHKNVVSWNAIICGYAQNGKAKKAIEFYHRMKDEGVKANDVTLLVLLLACNHGGLVEEGYSYFHKARIENPSMLKPEHYGCMVDLLSRSGRFQEAQHFISTMPFNAGIGFWKALLGGCQTHLNKELAEYAAKKILALVPGDVSSYVMLSNACSAAGNWQDVSMIRREMKEKKMQRIPGCSWIEIKSKVHNFVRGDKGHDQKDDIYFLLNLYDSDIKYNLALIMLEDI